jgi:hypothetical protein
MPATATKPHATTTPTGRRQVRLGDTVKFGNLDAIVIGIENEHDPDTEIAVAYTDEGRRRIAADVEHRLAPDGWTFSDEKELARARTPLELWEAAKQRGERVPEVGLIVTFAWNRAKAGYDILPCRARIVEVKGLEVVDLDVLKIEPPAEPDEPEKVVTRIHNCKAAFAGSDIDTKMGYPKMWEYRDGNRIKPFGPIATAVLFPPHVCPACHQGAARLVPMPVGPDPVRPRGDLVVEVCPACVARVRELLNPSPEACTVAAVA